ncbi:MAG: twin-arginine translocation signal domain-containing protein [Lentisphaerae bacterium]|nr:twin-arginine translocation signal domain-containing protein [Lentisphaerota bacterium]
MNRRDFMQLAGLGVLAAGLPQLVWAAGEPGAKVIPVNAVKPNILFILTDDLGIWDVGFTGVLGLQKTPNDASRMTPNLDQLAKAGAVFESFYVMPVCSPTRACLMTSRYAAHTGVNLVIPSLGSKWGLPLEERTLAQALKEAGYETAISGKWHLGAFEPAYLPTRRQGYLAGHHTGGEVAA